MLDNPKPDAVTVHRLVRFLERHYKTTIVKYCPFCQMPELHNFKFANANKDAYCRCCSRYVAIEELKILGREKYLEKLKLLTLNNGGRISKFVYSVEKRCYHDLSKDEIVGLDNLI